MKNLKVFILIASILFIMSSCSNSNTIEGYDTYENKEQGVKVQYPAEWTLIDGSLTDEQIQDYVDKFGDDLLTVLESVDFSTIVAMWNDFDKKTDDYTPNGNLNIIDMPGITQKELEEPEIQQGFQEMYEETFTGVLVDFKLNDDIKGQNIGGNYFLVLKYSFINGETELYGYQAMTTANEKFIVFSYVTFKNQFDTAVQQYEKMLSTFEITK